MRINAKRALVLVATVIVTCGLWASFLYVRGPPHHHLSRGFDRSYHHFERWAAKYGKVYSSDQETAQRFANWVKNRDMIRMHNNGEQLLAGQERTFTMELNGFADLTPEEWRARHMTCLSDKPNPGNRWGQLPHLGTHKYSGVQLPDSVDWAKKGAVTEIKDQGQCGSCWSFSTTGALEGRYEVITGQLTSLSEQQLLDCSGSYGNLGCNGGMMDAAFSFAEEHGICSEASYSYQMRVGRCHHQCDVAIPSGTVTGFMDVDHDEQSLMEALQNGPVSVAIEADMPSFQFYHGGVLTAKCGTQLDHGVLVVGYGTENGIDFWKVKNSWGPMWGDHGFIKLARGTGRGDECGILLQASYPVFKKSDEVVPVPVAPQKELAQAPAISHYDHPPCLQDEMELTVQGQTVSCCAPRCTQDGHCPMDEPHGTRAKPSCDLQTADNERFCSLMCTEDDECPHNGVCEMLAPSRGVCMFHKASSKATLATLRPTPSLKRQDQVEFQ